MIINMIVKIDRIITIMENDTVKMENINHKIVLDIYTK